MTDVDRLRRAADIVDEDPIGEATAMLLRAIADVTSDDIDAFGQIVWDVRPLHAALRLADTITGDDG